MKNSSGVLIWGNPDEYKNFVTFAAGSGSWTVPAGVTKIYVELWVEVEVVIGMQAEVEAVTYAEL